jgi:hypothetical protein
MNPTNQKTDSENLVAPCFLCEYCYTCKYWQNVMWSYWILKNKECPVNTYTFNSLYFSIIEAQAKKKQAEQSYNQKSRFPKKS